MFWFLIDGIEIASFLAVYAHYRLPSETLRDERAGISRTCHTW